MSADRTVGDLLQAGLTLMRNDTDEVKAKLLRILQTEYYRLCARTDWQPLRQTISLTFTGLETNGQYLPSDLINVSAVIDKTNEIVYWATEETNRYTLDGRYHWFTPSVSTTPLYEHNTGMSIEQSASTFSDSRLGTDAVGEYVQLDTEPGFYKITAANTLGTTYWGPKLNDKGCVVRPRSTRKMVLVDTAGALSAATVSVYYWAYPAPLYMDWQRPLLDGTLLETAMKADIARDMMWNPALAATFNVEEALTRALNENPKFLMPMVARAQNGTRLYFGRSR